MSNYERIANSSLWSAVGDALGFISELTDAAGVEWRSGVSSVEGTVGWRRTVGGRFGAIVDLPPGTYSDDTQLRLATSRAIRSDGQFDVEAFARVELPVWACYALGGGVSTKCAASALGHPDVNWYSNFFETKSAKYVDAGGNGAAMRIQPHIWASKAFEPGEYLPATLRNALCTHGHMRGVLGAVFHGFVLAETLKSGYVPSPTDWGRVLDLFGEVPAYLRRDPELSSFWLPVWESKAKANIDSACDTVRRECEEDIQKLCEIRGANSAEAYRAAIDVLGGFSPEHRGSGIKTALLASWLAWVSRDEDPAKTLISACNLLDTDTDTIATMAGAILGAVAKQPPSFALMDRDYVLLTSKRLSQVAAGERVENFRYPDLLSWRAPRTQADAIGVQNGNVVLSGLGEGELVSKRYRARKGDGLAWQWFRLKFGQTVLSKQRETLPQFQNPDSKALSELASAQNDSRRPKVRDSKQTDLFEKVAIRQKNESPSSVNKTVSLDALTNEAIRSGFDPAIVGNHILGFAEGTNGIEMALAYSAIIVKARRARRLSSAQGRELPNVPRGNDKGDAA